MTDWSAVSNCTVALDTTMGFTDVTGVGFKQSLKVTCTSTGTVQIAFNPRLPVTAPRGLVWGLHALGSAVHALTLIGSTYDSSGVLTNQNSYTTPLATTYWRPFAGATGANSALGGGATQYGLLTATCPMTNGDIFWIDTVGAFASIGQVLIDWLNPAFGINGTGGNDFVDLTGRTKFDTGISITRGRQDNFSEVQTANATVSLQNDDGWFTPQNNNSPWYGNISMGKRLQINATDETGKWWTRYDGAIAELDYAVDVTGGTNVCSITANDILAYLARQSQLSCWTQQTVLADTPALHWPLDDANGNFQEASGFNGPPFRLQSYGYSAMVTPVGGGTAVLTPFFGTMSYQGASGGVESEADTRANTVGPYSTPISSVSLTPSVDTTLTQQNLFRGTNGNALQTQLPSMLTPNASGQNYTIECWFTMDPTLRTQYRCAPAGPFTILSFAEARTGLTVCAGVYTSAGGHEPAQVGDPEASFKLASYAQPPAFIVNQFGNAASILHSTSISSFHTDQENQPHHLVIVLTGASAGGTATLWVDGVSIGSIPLSQKRFFDQFVLGSAYGGYGGWLGGIQLASIYNYALSSAQIANHYSMGLNALAATQTDTIVSTLMGIAGIPSYWNGVSTTGEALSLMDYFDLTGNSPIGAMQLAEQIETGLIYCTAGGKLMFHTRDWRQGYGAPDVTLPIACYNPDLGYSVTDQFLVTTSTIASAVSNSTGQTVTNQQSYGLYGNYPQGTNNSPNQLALLSFSGGFGLAGLQVYDWWNDPYVTDYSAWLTNANSTPYMRPTTLTVDLLAPDKHQPPISTLYAVDIDNVVAIAGLPASMPNDPISNEFFVEGINEVISQQTRTLQYLTTPASLQRAWRPGDATYGVLGISSRIGRSGLQTHAVEALGKTNGFDPGPPWWPPAVSTTMNNPLANGHGFFGSNDMRGIATQLQTAMSPPLCVVGQSGNTQSFNSGANSYLFWDTIYVDTLGCIGAVSTWPGWYVCLQAAYYDIDWSVVWQSGGTGNSALSQLVVSRGAAAAVLNGTGDPTTVAEVCTTTGQTGGNSGGDLVTVGSTRVYLGLGDMVTIACEQSFGRGFGSSNDFGGSIMSLKWAGISTHSDGY